MNIGTPEPDKILTETATLTEDTAFTDPYMYHGDLWNSYRFM